MRSLSGVNKRVLVVDDEKNIRFALGHYFTHLGFQVDSAGDAPEARELIAANDYALAIIDIHLEGRAADDNGLDLAALLRQTAPSTAVIILTGLESPEALRRAAEAGVRSFLRKPASLAVMAKVAFEVLRENEETLVSTAAYG